MRRKGGGRIPACKNLGTSSTNRTGVKADEGEARVSLERGVESGNKLAV